MKNGRKETFNDFISKCRNKILLACIIFLLSIIIINQNTFLSRNLMIFILGFLLFLIFCRNYYSNNTQINNKFGRRTSYLESCINKIKNFVFPSTAQTIHDSFRAQNYGTFESSSNVFESIKGSFLDKTKEIPFNQYNLHNDKIPFNNARINEQMTDRKRNSSASFFESNQRPSQPYPPPSQPYPPPRNDQKERFSPMSKTKNLKGF